MAGTFNVNLNDPTQNQQYTAAGGAANYALTMGQGIDPKTGKYYGSVAGGVGSVAIPWVKTGGVGGDLLPDNVRAVLYGVDPTTGKARTSSQVGYDPFAQATGYAFDPTSGALMIQNGNSSSSTVGGSYTQNASGQFVSNPTGGGGGAGGTGDGTVQKTNTSSTTNGVTQGAKDAVNKLLSEFGMGGLTDEIWNQWTSGTTADQIMEYVRKSGEYKTRFPAMATLNAAGRNISEAAYIGKEQADIELMKQYNIPSGVFDTKDYLGKLIANNVTQVDLQKRLIAAQDTVMSYDTSIIKYAKDTYGIGVGDLMAWALSPELALPVIQQQAKAMQIGGAAYAAGLAARDITKSEAESLATAGITQQQAQQGFTNIAQMGEYKQGMPGVTNPAEVVTSEDLINAQFATSPEAIVKVNKAKASKLAEYAQGGQFAATQAGLIGIGASPRT